MSPVEKEVRSLLDQGKRTEAVARLRSELEKDPDNIGLHRLYQDTLRAMGESDRLQKEYQARLLKAPDDALAHYLYGRALILERTREAQDEFKKAVELDPNFLWGYLGLSSAMKMNDDKFEAVQALEQGMKHIPDSPLLYLNLADVRYSMKLYREAIEAADKCIKLDPSLPEPYETAGFSYLMQGDDTNARKYLERALKLAPQRAGAHLGLAHVYLNKGDTATAKKYALQAKRLGREIPADLAKALGLNEKPEASSGK